MRLTLSLLFALLALAVPTVAAAANEPDTFRTGFYDGAFLTPHRDAWLTRAADAQSDVVRVCGNWSAVAPSRPASPSNPADPAYRWAPVDAAVRSAVGRGLDVLLCFTGAPRWAEGPSRPRRGVASGSWRPDAGSFGAFAQAVATRYSGSYSGLPRVSAFQPWNEPNLPRYLAPQYVDGEPASPAIYRDLVNAFTTGIKSVQPDALVAIGNTAPFGDPPGEGSGRMQPLTFVEELLKARTWFDVLATHPYAIRGPNVPARNIGDISVANIQDLVDVLRAAERRGVTPGARKRVWVTEFSYDSSPPDPEGVPAATHARWTAEAMYVAWRQGVDTFVWYQVGDDEPRPSYAATYQSGMFLASGEPKLSETAFAFPLVADRAPRGRADIWTRSPADGTLVVRTRAKGGAWRTVARLPARRHQLVTFRVKASMWTDVRASVAGQRSLTVKVRTVW